MIALMLLLVVIADTAITGYLLATVKGLKASVSANASVIRDVCEDLGVGDDAE